MTDEPRLPSPPPPRPTASDMLAKMERMNPPPLDAATRARLSQKKVGNKNAAQRLQPRGR